MSITHGLPTSVPPLVADPSHSHDDHAHDHGAHGHSHGLVDPSIVRSRAGVKAVLISFGVLGAAALVQTLIFVASGSVALLADLIHNFGDALTAIPLGIAFVLRSARGERLAGLAVVGAIFISACVALYESIERLVHPQHLSHLWALAAAGVVGFAANEIAARVRLRAGRRLETVAPQPPPAPTVRDYAFGAQRVSLRRGTTFTWRFRGAVDHDVTLASGPAGFASPSMRSGTFSYRFARAGTYRSFCSLHPARMTQVVIVH